MKVNKDLIVEIPIRFKKPLEAKWKAEKDLGSIKSCPLCQEYYQTFNNCSKCPLVKFDQNGTRLGCLWWQQALGFYYAHCTPAQLKSFLAKAKAHIRWIK